LIQKNVTKIKIYKNYLYFWVSIQFNVLYTHPFFLKFNPLPKIMLNKNLLLALLGLSLAGSWWWQKNKIENCTTTNTQVTVADSTAIMADSLTVASTAIVDTALSTPAVGTTEDDLAKNEKYSSIFKPMNLYFRTNEADYIKTDENQKFLEEAKAYLAENKDKSLSLTGHTDSDGADAANMKLSERRAIDVKGQLGSKGFNADQLTTDAKGETQPAASNETAEGKKANRRVTIVVNQ
jgi:outer membrane protein OmpA-like peptidoglycan-associated protein